MNHTIPNANFGCILLVVLFGHAIAALRKTQQSWIAWRLLITWRLAGCWIRFLFPM